MKKIQVEDYLKGTRSLTNIGAFSVRNSVRAGSQETKTYGLPGTLSIKDLPIKVLDRLIANEEKLHDGFSLYNRGEELKNCLIDANKVRAFIQKQEREQTQKRLYEPKIR